MAIYQIRPQLPYAWLPEPTMGDAIDRTVPSLPSPELVCLRIGGWTRCAYNIHALYMFPHVHACIFIDLADNVEQLMSGLTSGREAGVLRCTSCEECDGIGVCLPATLSINV
jgi:hypothetical protein